MGKEYSEVLRLMQGQFNKTAVWRAAMEEATSVFERENCPAD